MGGERRDSNEGGGSGRRRRTSDRIAGMAWAVDEGTTASGTMSLNGGQRGKQRYSGGRIYGSEKTARARSGNDCLVMAREEEEERRSLYNSASEENAGRDKGLGKQTNVSVAANLA